MKATQSEIKQNIQGTNKEGKETGTQINDLEQKEEINIQPEQDEETRIQKNEEELDNLSDAEFKTLIIRMLTEVAEYDCKMKEEMKSIPNEIK